MSTFTSSLTSEPAAPPAGPALLLPRFRWPLSFGALLDETFWIFRRAWRRFMLVLACAAVPIGLLTALWSAGLSGSLFQSVNATNTAAGSGDFGPLAGLYRSMYGGSVGLSLLTALLLLPAYAAVVYLTDGALRGRPVSTADALKRGLRATPMLILSGLLALLLILLLVIGSTVALLLTVFPGLFGITPLIGALVWWGNPQARKPWLCWLILLTTPFGLLWYFGYRWTLALPAIALEGAGPVDALSRSLKLTRGHWFRLFGAVTVLGIIGSILQGIPGLIVTVIGMVAAFLVAFAEAGSGQALLETITQDPIGVMSAAFTATSIAGAAAEALGTVLVGALPPIALTLLFHDLRNRHEGTDLAERLSAVSAAS